MVYFIGIDDTDKRGSRGTGFRSRQLSSELALAGFGRVSGVIRHQLYINEKISYTTQNGSNSICVECCDPEGLKNFCRNFLIRETSPGGSGGLCVIEEKLVPDEVEEWGRRAKRELLTEEEAMEIAARNNLFLTSVLGKKGGIIGALAAVGLRQTGNDGRFIWQPGKQLRDMRGTMTIEEFKKGTQIDDVITKDGKILGPEEKIDLTDWVRAVLINNQTYVLAERNLKRSGSDWKIADKEYIRKIGS
jgi:hypothetical protein